MNIIRKVLQHNWWAIVYFNFKMLPWRQAVKLPFDFYHNVRFDNLSGHVKINAPVVRRAMIKVGAQGSDMFHHRGCILAIEGEMEFDGSCVFGCSNVIKIRRGAAAHFGDKCIFGANNLLYSEALLEFGDEFLSSWDCQFMDSDTHKLTNMTNGTTTQSVKPVRIGRHCWIGNHVVVNKGVVLPNDTIVGTQSFVNKDFSHISSYSVLAGIPAKVVKDGMRWEI